MALNFASGTGNLFNRIGAVIYAIQQVQSYQSVTVPAYILDVQNQYGANPEMTPTINTTLTNAQSQAASPSNDMRTIASNTLIQMIQTDTPQPAATLDYAIPQLIAQMNAASASVNANTVTATPTAGTSNVGTGTCVVSLVGGDGKTLENVLAETLTVTCIQDSQPGQGATAGQETFAVLGDASVDPMNFAWPKGSGGHEQLTAASAGIDATTVNALTNGDFETFTVANTPDSWTVATGTIGTTVKKNTSNAYIGLSALEVVGNGSQLTRFTQQLRSSTSPGILEPQSKWCLAVYTKVSAAPATGVLQVALKTAAGGTVVGSVITVNLTTETTTYALHTATLELPLTLPANIYAVIELMVALENGKSVYIDEVVLTQMVQHANGPFISVIPGSTNFVRGDVFNVAITNDNGGKFQTYFNRMFGMAQRGLLLPSDSGGAETIPDSLIS
jgi:hypothetical protein